jgi:hypothetical protein
VGNTEDLGRVVEALRDSPEFLAGWLAYTPGGESWLSGRLSLDRARLERLLLCRSPRPASFPTDVQRIAALVGVKPDSLAATLREGAALTILSAAGRAGAEVEETAPPTGLLAAARDATEETISRGTVGGSYVRRLAEDVRARAPRGAEALLDIESFVAWSAPLAIVVLPKLNLTAAHGWLAERGAALGFGNRDRPLRGLLLAWRGSGLILVDGSLPMPERRFTVAHELGHFLLDYLEPRVQVLRKAPDLLEVLDGHRRATTQDRTHAVLERIKLGVHTHLLDRDPHGGAAPDVERGEDLSSRFALELLSPWNAVRTALRRLPDGVPWATRLEEATRRLEAEFDLPKDAARARARAALESMEKGPGFLER